jgi:hypothetical protein
VHVEVCLLLRAPHMVRQFAQHRLLCKLFGRVWCGLTVCATVWRFWNRFEFRCVTVRLCDSLKHVWTCLCAVVPRHQFIIDSNTVCIVCSKRHIQLQIKNCSQNLYSFIGWYRHYGKWNVMCIKTTIWRMLVPVDMFSLWHLPRDWSLCKLIVSCVDTVSCCITHCCTTHCCMRRCCAILCNHVWGPLDTETSKIRF